MAVRIVLYILLVLAVFVFYLIYRLWISWYFLMLVIVLPLISLGICFYVYKTLKIVMNAPNVTEMKSTSYIKFTAKTTAFDLLRLLRYRVKIKIRDVMTDRTEIITVNTVGKTVKQVPIKTTHCGVYEYSVQTVRVFDIFGIFSFKKPLKQRGYIMVMPLPQTSGVNNLDALRARSYKRSNNPYTEIYDIRDYYIGDPVKTIHWKSSAKKDKLMVKEPQEQVGGRTRIFVKLSNERSEVDRRLGELLYICDYFMDKNMEMRVCVLPSKCDISARIHNKKDVNNMFFKIMSLRLPTRSEEPKNRFAETAQVNYDDTDSENAGAV